MRIRVTLTITGEKETILDGACSLFGNGDYQKGVDTRLRDIGFWLENWRYGGQSGPNSKSRVFIPWGSALMVQELK